MSVQYEPIKKNTQLITVEGLSKEQQNIIYADIFKTLDDETTKILKKKKPEEQSESIIQTILNIVSKYDDDVLHNFIIKYIGKSLVIKNYLYDFCPRTITTAKNLVFTCVKYSVSVQVIESLVNKMDINYRDNNDTCLYRATDIDYLISLLSSEILKFDVNNVNKNYHTFLSTWLFKNGEISKMDKLIDVAEKRGYDFNISLNNEYFLDYMCISPITTTNQIKKLVGNPKCDITLSSMWLYNIIKHKDPLDIRNILCIIVSRPDCNSFLNKIMGNYVYGSGDEDMLLVINIILLISVPKLKSMVTYKNPQGNNVLHIASMYHYDKCIRFMCTHPNLKTLNIISEKNNDSDTPSNLYQKNSIESLLHQEIKLF